MRLWWLSFCDPDRPKGTQFLGACMVWAISPVSAVIRCHALGINPGGEIQLTECNTDPTPFEPWIDRLMSRAEIDAMHALLPGPPRDVPGSR